MNILLELLDLIVLVSIVIQVVRRVWAAVAYARGATILTLFVMLVAVFFAIVSFTVYVGLVEDASPLMRMVLLLFIVGMAILVGVSWRSKSAAQVKNG